MLLAPLFHCLRALLHPPAQVRQLSSDVAAIHARLSFEPRNPLREGIESIRDQKTTRQSGRSDCPSPLDVVGGRCVFQFSLSGKRIHLLADGHPATVDEAFGRPNNNPSMPTIPPANIHLVPTELLCYDTFRNRNGEAHHGQDECDRLHPSLDRGTGRRQRARRAGQCHPRLLQGAGSATGHDPHRPGSVGQQRAGQSSGASRSTGTDRTRRRSCVGRLPARPPGTRSVIARDHSRAPEGSRYAGAVGVGAGDGGRRSNE